ELNQCPRLILRQGLLQALDGLDLAVTQTVRIQGRQLLQPRAKGFRLQQPLTKGLWTVECEHPARTRLRVAPVAEEGLLAGALVRKDERVMPAREMDRQIDHVLGRLI